ncbi:MAG TPA: hypothetical protein VEI98_05425 [Xanthobacteraceae bacterium]|nr:hypothetical protein [Xanthobacteraceae bacterium]
MRKSRFSRFVGVLLALLAVSALTLLQVDYANAAVQAQTTQVRIILSQAQLAVLAKRDHALYAQVIKAYRSGSPLVVTQREYRVLSRLSTAYLGAAKAGQPAPGAPGSATNPITVGKTNPPLPAPMSGPLVPYIHGLAQLAAGLAAGATLFPPLAAASGVVLGIELVLIIINVILTLPWPTTAPAK